MACGESVEPPILRSRLAPALAPATTAAHSDPVLPRRFLRGTYLDRQRTRGAADRQIVEHHHSGGGRLFLESHGWLCTGVEGWVVGGWAGGGGSSGGDFDAQ